MESQQTFDRLIRPRADRDLRHRELDLPAADARLRTDLPYRYAKGQAVWDPTTSSYRTPRIPLSLSKSSLSPVSPDGRPSSPKLPYQRSVSVATSTSSSLHSLPSSSTSLSLHGKQSGKGPMLPQRIFRNLPPAIYDCILRQLRSIHISKANRSCQTCYMRDLCALSLTSRAWDKAALKILYERIHIVGSESKDQTHRNRPKFCRRLHLLRRTLRGRIYLARMVRELKVPTLYADGEDIPQEMIDLVASVVMACPNLERLDGLHLLYTHEYDRLTHALSTRRRLKEHIWLIGENDAITERSQTQLPPGLMDYGQKSAFVHHHNAWSMLTTLLLYSPDNGVLEKDIFVNSPKNRGTPDTPRIRGPGILHRLPSLQHLCIANFDMDDFDDHTLQSLPPLFSLRLQDLEGVTFWGLSEYARTRSAFYIRNLSLVNLDITYISAISNLLLHLKNLLRFTLVQDTSPEIAEGEHIFQPIIASYRVEYIHWDIPVRGTATENLALSIRAGGFPRLRTIRIPSDHDGRIQALCKPRACIELPSDWSGKNILRHGLPRGGLREARRRAQQRIEDAWSTVQFKVVVEDVGDNGNGGGVSEIFDLNGFMGTVGSKIDYVLEPDVPGSDHALMDFADVVGSKEVVVPRPLTVEEENSPAGGGKDRVTRTKSKSEKENGSGGGKKRYSKSKNRLMLRRTDSIDRLRSRAGTPTTVERLNAKTRPGEDDNGGGSGGEDDGVCRGAWNHRHSRGQKWWYHADRPRYERLDLTKFF